MALGGAIEGKKKKMKAERIRSFLFHSFPIFFSSTSTPSYFLLHFLLLSLLSPPRYALAVFPILGTRDTPQEPPSRKKKPQTSTHTLSLSLLPQFDLLC